MAAAKKSTYTCSKIATITTNLEVISTLQDEEHVLCFYKRKCIKIYKEIKRTGNIFFDKKEIFFYISTHTHTPLNSNQVCVKLNCEGVLG